MAVSYNGMMLAALNGTTNTLELYNTNAQLNDTGVPYQIGSVVLPAFVLTTSTHTVAFQQGGAGPLPVYALTAGSGLAGIFQVDGSLEAVLTFPTISNAQCVAVSIDNEYILVGTSTGVVFSIVNSSFSPSSLNPTYYVIPTGLSSVDAIINSGTTIYAFQFDPAAYCSITPSSAANHLSAASDVVSLSYLSIAFTIGDISPNVITQNGLDYALCTVRAPSEVVGVMNISLNQNYVASFSNFLGTIDAPLALDPNGQDAYVSVSGEFFQYCYDYTRGQLYYSPWGFYDGTPFGYAIRPPSYESVAIYGSPGP